MRVALSKTIAILVGVALLISGVAFAKPNAVPGVGCGVCHNGPPSKKTLTEKAAAMFALHKDLNKCKECHSKGDGGKMATKAPAEPEAKAEPTKTDAKVDVASAPSSRDELMAKGATQLSGTELKLLLSGKQISGPTFDGATLNWTLKSDGSFSGYGQFPNGRTTHVGTWNINEKGQFCFSNQVSWSGGSLLDLACQDWFRLGTDFYAIRDGHVLKRQVM